MELHRRQSRSRGAQRIRYRPRVVGEPFSVQTTHRESHRGNAEAERIWTAVRRTGVLLESVIPSGARNLLCVLIAPEMQREPIPHPLPFGKLRVRGFGMTRREVWCVRL